MIRELITDNVTTTAKVLNGKLSQFDADGLLFDMTIAGSGFALTYFDTVLVSATLRGQEGDDLNIFTSVRMSDLLKLSDFSGGNSMALAGAVNGKFRAFASVGNIILDGDDTLEIRVTCPGHATTTMDIQVSACDFVRQHEKVMGYESIKGADSYVLIKNAVAVYLCSAATGASIAVEDQERQYQVLDRQIIASANALGKLEKVEDFGVIYNEPSGLSQDVQVKVPTNAQVLAVRAHYPIKRINRKVAVLESKTASLEEKIRIADPDKYAYLEAFGLVGRK